MLSSTGVAVPVGEELSGGFGSEQSLSPGPELPRALSLPLPGALGFLAAAQGSALHRRLSPTVLQLFCSSPKAALRYAAVRTLNKVSSQWTEGLVFRQGWGRGPGPRRPVSWSLTAGGAALAGLCPPGAGVSPPEGLQNSRRPSVACLCPHRFAPGQVAMKHPSAVTACNLDLENLVTDANRSIATLAITTLLKTGSEGSIDRLMKQISSFMSEISDEFKVHSLRPGRGGPGAAAGPRCGAVRGAAPGLCRRAWGLPDRPVQPFVVSRERCVLCWAEPERGAEQCARRPALGARFLGRDHGS